MTDREPSPSASPHARLQLLEAVLPIRRDRLPAEILAGFTLAALAIPEVMGYTKIAGTPVVTGLYTMLLPAILFACFGSSRHLVVGADSATAAILAAGLVGLAATGTEQYVALAGTLALLVAALLLLARALGLAFMADFLSRTVLIGFLTGVGIQVALSQLAGMLGLEGSGHGAMQKLLSVGRQLPSINLPACGVAMSVIVIVLGIRRLSRRIPGALLAVIGAVCAGWLFELDRLMPVVGSMPGGLPPFGIPSVDWSWELLRSLLPAAFAMAVVILAQSAATSRAYAARYDEDCSENRDLLGLSLANVGAALSGTFVVNGSPTKSQMVDGAGGRSQLAMLVAAVVAVVVLLFLTAPLAYLPEAALAALVFLIGVELIDVTGMRRVYDQRRSEFWIALATALMVVVVGVQEGILLAIVLSLVDHTRRGYRPKNVLLVPDRTGAWRPRPLATRAQAAPGLAVYRFTHSMYYANAQQLSNEILTLVDTADPALRWLCVDMSAVDDVDFTAAETVRTLYAELGSRGVRLVVAQEAEDLEASSHYHLHELFGDDAFFDSLNDVLTDYGQSRL